MKKEEKYRLCGGTFFVLLSDARKPLLSKNENYMGKRVELQRLSFSLP